MVNTHPQGEGFAPPPAQRRGWPAWAWLLIFLLLVILLPIAACGAFGLSVSLAGSRAATPVVSGPSVAVIDVEGQIVAGKSAGFGAVAAGSDTIVDLIEQAGELSGVRAIVLRVNSPGGDIVASDEIYRALQRVDKPVVVSMGSIAASGGYYISVAADHIYATPYTLTGSIGVISQFFNAQELLEDLGVEVITITSGEVKDFGNFARPMTEEERAYWQALIDDTYEGFLSIVAEGRSLPVDEVREIADGRVILGGDAVELGLVDELGYFEDAVAKAAELGGIEGEPRIVELKPQTGLFESLYGLESLMRRSEVLDLLQRTGAPPSLEFRYAAP